MDVAGDEARAVVKNESQPQHWKIQQTHSSTQGGIFIGKFLTSIINGIQSQQTNKASCGSVELRFLRAAGVVAISRTREISPAARKANSAELLTTLKAFNGCLK